MHSRLFIAEFYMIMIAIGVNQRLLQSVIFASSFDYRIVLKALVSDFAIRKIQGLVSLEYSANIMFSLMSLLHYEYGIVTIWDAIYCAYRNLSIFKIN